MRYNHRSNGRPQLTWVNIIATLALLATVAAGAWILFQQQFNSMQLQLQSSTSSLNSDIRENRAELERLRNLTILRNENNEHVKRVDEDIGIIRERLKVLESTRPTAGELDSTNAGTREQISDVKLRLRSIEDSLRRQTSP
jgi:hypothetical protein